MKLLEINSEDLEFNIEKIKQRAKDTKIIAVVKGNGYGLDLIQYADFLEKNDIDYFAVSSVEEAIELKKAKKENVLCMEATSSKNELEELLENGSIITIGDTTSAEIMNNLARDKKIKAKVHLKVDTGFSRYGFNYENKEEILNVIKNNTSLYVEGIFSHFSCAYFSDQSYTIKQYNRFLSLKSYLEENNIEIPIYHICNSSAFLKYDNMFLDAVRIGSAFLGRISVNNKLDLRKIGCLKSNVVSVKEIKKGTPIGYSNSEIAKKNMKLAIVPIGYSDGFNIEIGNDTFKFIDKVRIVKNSLKNIFNKNKLYVKIDDRKFNVIGRVGMNHVTIDVTDSDVKVDDVVQIDINPILISSKIRREYL